MSQNECDDNNNNNNKWRCTGNSKSTWESNGTDNDLPRIWLTPSQWMHLDVDNTRSASTVYNNTAFHVNNHSYFTTISRRLVGINICIYI